ncbi:MULTISPECIES: flagellar assembly protein FliW [Clostridium]|uniref:flagellar assembly protein FliW n=1 Tax=Clostridium TaxID=1485 RepID=UPI0005FB8C76|nr:MULTISPECIES: flagellar assembly protein FliW [Clostridium]MBZ0312884.1 flagellar assembly protein FliW [Clostridium butyricum]MDU0322329.1 flagellar assembly protein FliW [Clostridium butyricum]MDU1068712.1 flagellar assembly protein FliW [Clostridium sp.]MDU1336955.1 flagellar assembly protein FliW [Clostridium butyricum]MDU2676296.1 flagellar assembly protein FliW [Clostridium sp.]
MELISKIHGKINYDEKNVITFNKGIPGFSDLKKFVIVDLEGYEPFKLLHSLENFEIALIVTSPYEFYDNYEIDLKEETINNLKIKEASEVKILSTITLNSDVKKITINLQGPIVINTSNKLGEQIILDDSKYKVKTPLVKEA